MNLVQPQASWNSTDPRVTVVEADSALALTLSDDLRTEGYFVESVNRGKEALRRLTDAPPDLVILDWMLPGMSGPIFVFDCARRKRHGCCRLSCCQREGRKPCACAAFPPGRMISLSNPSRRAN